MTPEQIVAQNGSRQADSRRLRVMIVDDHRLFAESVRWALEAGGFEVIGIASRAAEAIKLSRADEPDVVLTEINLPDGDGITAGRTIMESVPGAAVVGVTDVVDRQTVADAFEAGFRDYLPKNSSIEQLISRIRAVASGEPASPRRIDRVQSITVHHDEHVARLARTLTKREREILALIAEGASGPVIASRLGLSRNTVRTHAQNVLTKLQVGSRLEAAAFAVQHGLIPPSRTSR